MPSRQGHVGRRRARCVRRRAAEGLAPGDAAAGGRDAAHRGVHQRSAGAGRDRNGRGVARFSEGRHHPQRRELPFCFAGRIQAAAALPDAGEVSGARSSRKWARRGSTPSACAITASWRSEDNQLLGSAVLEGVFCAILSSGGVTPVNARTIAAERGIELIESRSTRARNYTSLISVKLHTSEGDRWVEGTVFANGSLRLVLVDGVAVEAPLEGTLLIIKNNDQPGVIGDVGTLLGRHRVNIASFALGRDPDASTARLAW